MSFACRNCAGTTTQPVYSDVVDRFQGTPGAYAYVACSACGLVQLGGEPPDPAELYKNYRVHTGDSALHRTMRKLLIGHCYLEKRGDGKRLLDIGCGNGSYMQLMASHGWKPTGYEPNAGYAASLAHTIGWPVLSGEQALKEHAGEFDLVTFNFSFEHLCEPLRTLELAAECLKPGGEIYIVVPNIESREAAIFKDRWFHLDPPRHITFFTKQLLGNHLQRHGFDDIKVKNVAVPTGFAGSVSYKLLGKFQPLAWYAGMLPGVLFSTVVRDGNFAITARRSA